MNDHTLKSQSLGSLGEQALDPGAKGLSESPCAPTALPALASLALSPLEGFVHRCRNLNLHLLVSLVRRQSLALDCDHLLPALFPRLPRRLWCFCRICDDGDRCLLACHISLHTLHACV